MFNLMALVILNIYLFIYLFFYLAAPGLSCDMQDLVSWPGFEPGPPALGAQTVNHWTTREVSPTLVILNWKYDALNILCNFHVSIKLLQSYVLLILII